jgi:hypothetical protein
MSAEREILKGRRENGLKKEAKKKRETERE